MLLLSASCRPHDVIRLSGLGGREGNIGSNSLRPGAAITLSKLDLHISMAGTHNMLIRTQLRAPGTGPRLQAPGITEPRVDVLGEHGRHCICGEQVLSRPCRPGFKIGHWAPDSSQRQAASVAPWCSRDWFGCFLRRRASGSPRNLPHVAGLSSGSGLESESDSELASESESDSERRMHGGNVQTMRAGRGPPGPAATQGPIVFVAGQVHACPLRQGGHARPPHILAARQLLVDYEILSENHRNYVKRVLVSAPTILTFGL